jgi:hypothetical protein
MNNEQRRRLIRHLEDVARQYDKAIEHAHVASEFPPRNRARS